jgi:hypothetical protein
MVLGYKPYNHFSCHRTLRAGNNGLRIPQAVIKTFMGLRFMLKHLVLVIALTAILSCGQNTPLAVYEPKSSQEKALKRVLLDLQDGVNTMNSKKVENFIHEKASIMVGRDRKILSKAEIVSSLSSFIWG